MTLLLDKKSCFVEPSFCSEKVNAGLFFFPLFSRRAEIFSIPATTAMKVHKNILTIMLWPIHHNSALFCPLLKSMNLLTLLYSQPKFRWHFIKQKHSGIDLFGHIYIIKYGPPHFETNSHANRPNCKSQNGVPGVVKIATFTMPKTQFHSSYSLVIRSHPNPHSGHCV